MAIKAFSYIRWSSKGQTDGDSLRRQLESAEAYALANGLELDTHHRDEGVSSFHGRHRLKGALGAFLSKVESGEIESGSYLLVENFDRLTREDVSTALDLFLSLTRAGITVVTLSDGRAYNRESINRNWTDLILTLASMARAHEENAIKGRRVRAAHRQSKNLAREEGRVWTPKGPSWAKLVDGKFAEIPERANVIRQIYDLAENGVAVGAIAHRLNKVNAPALGRRGWNRDAVSDVLASRTVVGEYQPTTVEANWVRKPDGPPIRSYYPVVISEARFARVRALLSTFKAKPRGGGSPKRVNNVFQGLCRCGECGGTVGVHNSLRNGSPRPSALRCVNNSRHMPGHYYQKDEEGGTIMGSDGRPLFKLCENKTRVSYPKLEAAILDVVLEVEVSESIRDPLDSELETAVARRDALEERVNNLMNQLAAKDDGRLRRFYDQQGFELDQAEAEVSRIQGLLDKRGPRTSNATTAARDLYAKLGTLDGDALYDARSKLMLALRSVIDTMEFSPTGEVTVVLCGGLLNYRFSGKEFETVRRIDMTGDTQVFVRKLKLVA